VIVGAGDGPSVVLAGAPAGAQGPRLRARAGRARSRRRRHTGDDPARGGVPAVPPPRPLRLPAGLAAAARL